MNKFLSDNHIMIEVRDATSYCAQKWVKFGYKPSGGEMLLYMSCEIDSVRYEWSGIWDASKKGLQDMIEIGISAFKRKFKESNP